MYVYIYGQILGLPEETAMRFTFGDFRWIRPFRQYSYHGSMAMQFRLVMDPIPCTRSCVS